MKKTELFRAYYKLDAVDQHIWSCWVDWRRKQAGIEQGEDGWYKIMEEIPKFYEWDPYQEDGHVTFTWDGGKEHIPLSEFVDDLDQQEYLEMLWHAGYYDGPLSGMADFNGEMVWFDLAEENDDRYRTYNLYRLTKEERDIICRDHERFQKMVGRHCDYGDEHREYGDDEEDRPGWCPLWAWKIWRQYQFNSFYRTSHKREEVDFESKQPFLVVDQCQFKRRRK